MCYKVIFTVEASTERILVRDELDCSFHNKSCSRMVERACRGQITGFALFGDGDESC